MNTNFPLRRVIHTVTTLCALTYLCDCTSPEEADPFEEDCRAFCNWQYNCGLPLSTPREHCVDHCQDEFELEAVDLGPACEDAFKQAMTCLAGMTCDESQKFNNIPLEEEPCYQALAPYYELCPGVFIAPESG